MALNILTGGLLHICNVKGVCRAQHTCFIGMTCFTSCLLVLGYACKWSCLQAIYACASRFMLFYATTTVAAGEMVFPHVRCASWVCTMFSPVMPVTSCDLFTVQCFVCVLSVSDEGSTFLGDWREASAAPCPGNKSAPRPLHPTSTEVESLVFINKWSSKWPLSTSTIVGGSKAPNALPRNMKHTTLDPGNQGGTPQPRHPWTKAPRCSLLVSPRVSPRGSWRAFKMRWRSWS